MTRFKATLTQFPPEALTGAPDMAYFVNRLDGTTVGVVSRRGRKWVADQFSYSGDEWWLVGTRAEAVKKLGGTLK